MSRADENSACRQHSLMPTFSPCQQTPKKKYDEFFDDREFKQRAQRSLKPHFNQKYLVKCTVFRGIFPKYEKKSSDKEPQRLLKDN